MQNENGYYLVFHKNKVSSLSYDSEGYSSPLVSQQNILRPLRVNKLHSEVFLKVNLGRLLVFLKFAEDLELTQEEWGPLYAVIYPTLIYQIWEQLYKAIM